MTKATDIDTLDRKYKEMNASWHEASGAQKAVTEAGEDSDTFTVKTTQQMKDFRAELDKINETITGIKARLEKMFNYF